MQITGLKISGGSPPFTDPVEFRFDRQANLFIGPNSTGKTSIIRMLSHPPHELPDALGFQHGQWQFWLEVSDDWPHLQDAHGEYPDWNAVPFIQIGATRLALPLASEKPDAPHRDYDDMPLRDIFSHCYETNVFDANMVEAALRRVQEESIKKGGAMGLGRRIEANRIMEGHGEWTEAAWNLQSAINTSYQCTQTICAEVVAGETAVNSVRQSRGIGIYERPPEIRPAAAIRTLAGGQLENEVLSSGIQSSLLWIRFLALKMVHHYQFEDGWENRPAILLIDEIENHLHPTWQRRVIPALLEHFPGLQIFATTHSPFVVAGLKAGQVHLLNRDANGVITASTNTEDIEGWTADEILRVYMGVDEPTDQLTIDRAHRLRELRGRETLSDAEKDEMEELRRQVNEDFMSSSTPLEAQRERYGEMMLDFLRSRQSELSQDGA